MTVQRVDPPCTGDELTLLTSWLDWHRATLLRKCEALSDDELRSRPLPPSTLSLLGLVRHMAEVERGWFRVGMAQEAIGDRWITDDRPDADFDDVDAADVDEAFAALDEECGRARAVVHAASSLDVTFPHPRRGDVSLRWVLIHMIEEYARHNGHADLLRERIDASTGF